MMMQHVLYSQFNSFFLFILLQDLRAQSPRQARDIFHRHISSRQVIALAYCLQVSTTVLIYLEHTPPINKRYHLC